jgi:hypothetical protein
MGRASEQHPERITQAKEGGHLMIRTLTRSKKRTAALGSLAAIAAVVAAIAYFIGTGSGTGQATVGTSTPWGVTFQSTTGTMYPGLGTSTVRYTVTNNGPGNQHLNTTTASVVNDGSGNVTSSGTPVTGCLASWFSVTNHPPAAATLAPSATTTGTADVAMTESGTNQDACKSVTPDILISAS